MSGDDSPIVIDQYRALRDGLGFVELADWSSVTVTGADRQAFLNSFCTNDVKRLAPGQCCEAFFTNVKGKVIGHGLVTCRENEMVFVTVPGQAASLIAHLERYVIREDVVLRDTTAERMYLLLSNLDLAVGIEKTYRIKWNLLDRSHSGLIELASSDVARAAGSLEAAGAILCDLRAFETVRIEAGTPLFGVDFNDSNLPQEVGREDRAISFTKGCYLGQETVARIDALGHVNQQLAGVQFSSVEVPRRGSELTSNGRNAGHLTSTGFSPRIGAPLALAMLRREFLPGDTQLNSEVGPCQVVSLPIRGAND
jgi:tRNA-modifying protein YgfZ